MKIELYIENEKKIFTAPFIPMMAKRKYLELLAEAEKKEEELSVKEQLNEQDEIFSIFTDIIFKGQFTLDDLYNGNSKEYLEAKLNEAVFGVKVEEVDEGNEQGK